MITIVVSLRGRVITAQSFEQERIRIGRGPDNEVRIDNPALSRHHAVIEREGRIFTLVDLSERNGVYLNGERVRRRHLNHGDTIGLGKFVLTVDLTSRVGAGPLRRAPAPTGERTCSLTPAPTRPVARALGAVALAHLRLGGGEDLVLDRDACLVGAGSECHVRTPGLLAPRRVALLIRGHGGFSLMNLAAPRHVRLGGRPVDGRVWLHDRDELLLCGTRATFLHGLPAAVAARGAA